MRLRPLIMGGGRRAALAFAAAAIALVCVGGLAQARPLQLNGQIAYDRTDPDTGDGTVYTANPDGNHELQLVAGGCCPSWSHDGSRVATPYLTDDFRIGTATVNPDGSGYTPLPIEDPTLNVGCAGGAWAPDDAELACESWDESNPDRGGIYTMSSFDGSNLTRLTDPSGGDDQPGAYSPDGKRLVFARFDQNGEGVGLFVVKLSDGRLRQITPAGTLIQAGNDGDWSPQGNEIIFSRHVTPDVRGSIWVVHADGTGLHQIRIRGLDCGGQISDPGGFGCHAAHWSPDGAMIIFAANSPATGVNIYTANADGSGAVQVTADGGADDPVWGTHPLTP